MKNKINSNLNSYRDTTKKIIRPKSVFKKEMGPIKIMAGTTKNKDIDNRKINDENKDTNNIMKSSKYNSGLKSYTNNYNTLETKEDMTIDFPSNLPILSHNNRTINNQRAKTAKDKYKMKLDNLEMMFHAKPNLYYEKNKNSIQIKKFGLIPGIPDELMPRLNLVFKLFKIKNL